MVPRGAVETYKTSEYGEAIIRDTITPLITPDTQVYQQLERLIFG